MNYESKIKNKGPVLSLSNGFAALMSVIILSVILLLIATTLSMTGFAGRLNILDSEYKERSLVLAEACVDMAILRLTQNPTYLGNESVSVGGDTCNIRNFDPNPDPITIETKSTFQKAVTNLRVVVVKSDLSVISWQEVPNF